MSMSRVMFPSFTFAGIDQILTGTLPNRGYNQHLSPFDINTRCTQLFHSEKGARTSVEPAW